MVTKKSSKKSTKKTSKKVTSTKGRSKKSAKIVYEQPKNKKDYFFPILLIVVAVIVIGFVSNGTFFLDKFSSSSQPTMVEGNQTVLVSVNGENIYQSELDEYWARLPAQLKLEISKDQLLEEFIQERLLLQEADKEGIAVSDSEVDEYITAQLSASGLTYDQFQILLEQQGTTLERMKDIYARQLKLAKLFEIQNNEDLTSTPEEIQAYYAANKESFYQSEQVTVRHLLVSINENVNETLATQRVADLEAQLDEENNENFCDLVSEYSGDPGSVANCGEYTFGRGQMVSEFEEAGFDMDINERRTVKTAFGYHIMLKDAELPAGYLSLDEEISTDGSTVADAVDRILAEEKAREVYNTYIIELKEKAEIFYVLAAEPSADDLESNDGVEEVPVNETDNEVEGNNTAGEVMVEVN